LKNAITILTKFNKGLAGLEETQQRTFGRKFGARAHVGFLLPSTSILSISELKESVAILLRHLYQITRA